MCLSKEVRKKDREHAMVLLSEGKYVPGLIPRKKDRQGAMSTSVIVPTPMPCSRIYLRYFLLNQDSIAGWFASSPLVSSVDTNSVTIKMLHQYICHLGGKAKRRSSESQVCEDPNFERTRMANGYCMEHVGQRYESLI
jgi:hypothetical protein